MPRSQPGFPRGAATRWLLQRCKLHRLSQGAGDDNALESHLFHVRKWFQFSFEHMPTYLNVSKETNALVYYRLGQYIVEPSLSIISFFFFPFLINVTSLRGYLQNSHHRRTEKKIPMYVLKHVSGQMCC